ncbi:MAG: aspartate aminotransferase family protein [Saprospiraceae bacterium]|nr:aspartate aminotransferase family protein [Saprospiraceae bacterium]MCB9325246.1 aspartate aminotransferase family protein [Lewinellaceae bacterium]
MSLFDVYPRFDITLTRGNGVFVYDEKDQEYLDLYGGHGVISVGHSHPEYVKKVGQQLEILVFYSNSINMPLQDALAEKLAKQSGYPDYNLFFCNSGAEANENAIKLASFHTGKRKIVAFNGSFHGRTSGALNITDNLSLSAPLNRDNFPVEFIELNEEIQLVKALEGNDVAAVIVEGIQGVGGLDMPTDDYLRFLEKTCKQYGALLILDEIQSGYGRSGKFFAHQFSGIRADIISVAKGMGNGFPIAGVLIHPEIKAAYGMLGTTFGGSHLACAAGLAVLEIIQKEKLEAHVSEVSQRVIEALKQVPGIKKIKGRGLMLGVEFDYSVKELRSRLLFEHRIFTGSASNPNLLRILPPLNITFEELNGFITALEALLRK